jgi:hypothetical protein
MASPSASPASPAAAASSATVAPVFRADHSLECEHIVTSVSTAAASSTDGSNALPAFLTLVESGTESILDSLTVDQAKQLTTALGLPMPSAANTGTKKRQAHALVEQLKDFLAQERDKMELEEEDHEANPPPAAPPARANPAPAAVASSHAPASSAAVSSARAPKLATPRTSPRGSRTGAVSFAAVRQRTAPTPRSARQIFPDASSSSNAADVDEQATRENFGEHQGEGAG